ncbi:MAG TPA: hypothetical protein VLC07_04730 [Solirubrobacterales bacterium]|nr:hypothetical protein [Solirubrobacterales bacterium]
MSENGRLEPVEYADLVSRVQAAVTEHVPPGASVLVVSKGDAALVELPGLAAAHFPQDAAGGYAGHHPHDSAVATAELEELRRRGAEYLVLPDTARWWLDFYGGLATHLATHAELVADVPGACLIFGLGRRQAQQAGPPLAERPRASLEQVREYLESLIDGDSRVAVLEVEGGLAPALAPLRANGLRVAELAEGEALRSLRRAILVGAEYLVVPRTADEWLAENENVAAEIEESCRKIADQRHLCRVYALNELSEGEMTMGGKL